MSPLPTALWAAALAVGVALFLAERRTVDAQGSRLTALAADHERLQREIARLRQETDAATRAARDTTASVEQLESATHAANSNPLALESSAWLSRFHQLKQLFASRPDQRIPEMDLLADRDLLMCARDASFATDDGTRRALASVRTAAKQKFVRSLAKAVRDYKKANHDQLPADAAALAPFLPPPLNATHLSRWEVPPPKAGHPVHNLLTEKSAIDPDHDSRLWLQASGGTSAMSPPLAWIPDYTTRSLAARQAFGRANHGVTAPNLAALIPYFDPPLDAATAEKLLRSDRERPAPP